MSLPEQLIKWYNELACECPTSTRLSSLLSDMGGGEGIDVSSIKGRGTTIASDMPPITQRINRIIMSVLLNRTLDKPDVAAGIFGLGGQLSYCTCSEYSRNFSLSTMTIWDTKSSTKEKKVTCPACSDDRPKAEMSNPRPLTTFLLELAGQSDCELMSIYALVMNATGGCGRGVGDTGSQQFMFRGSWTSLAFDTTNNILECEVLVSNRVTSSLRLQPKCVCSDLLYAMSSLSISASINTSRTETDCSLQQNKTSAFAYTPTDIRVIGDGEFLYFKYIMFKEGGPFDSVSCPVTALCNAVVKDPKTICIPYSSQSKQRKPKQNNVTPLNIIDDKMSVGNVVDFNVLLRSVLSTNNGVSGGAKTTNTTNIKKKKKKQTQNFCVNAPQGSKLDGFKKFYNANGDISTDADGCCIDNVILPCPQIEEKSIASFLRGNNGITPKRVSIKTTFACRPLIVLDVQKCETTGTVYPPDFLLFAPPVITRIELNRFRLCSGLYQFFDCIYSNEALSLVDTRNAHALTLKLCASIRMNSIRRCLEVTTSKGNTTGVNKIVLKEANTNTGAFISHYESNKRKLCEATLLTLLSGMN